MSEDTAGPIIGWSLGTGMKKRAFDDLLSFPCVHAFKAVGIAGEDLEESLRKAVAEVLGREVSDAQLTTRDSERGNYRSVTLRIPVENSDEVYEIYRILSEHSAIRYVL